MMNGLTEGKVVLIDTDRRRRFQISTGLDSFPGVPSRGSKHKQGLGRESNWRLQQVRHGPMRLPCAAKNPLTKDLDLSPGWIILARAFFVVPQPQTPEPKKIQGTLRGPEKAGASARACPGNPHQPHQPFKALLRWWRKQLVNAHLHAI